MFPEGLHVVGQLQFLVPFHQQMWPSLVIFDFMRNHISEQVKGNEEYIKLKVKNKKVHKPLTPQREHDWKRHCLRVRYRTPRLRGYGSGTGPRATPMRTASGSGSL